jgi:dTDP-glucose 4,6-dehydratase
MKNMLVTGGCGFIGSNFVRYLLEEAADFKGRVVNLDKITYAGNPENLDGISERFDRRYVFVHGDICDRELVASVIDTYHIDAICHFAAESHVDRSIASPQSFIQTNIVGTFTLLELARSRSIPEIHFHHISTDEVFGSLGDTGAFTEKSPYHPNSPYAASKAGADHLVRAYHTTYGLPVTLSNCSNNYGPYQFPEKLIPLMILNALEFKPLPVYGDGRNVRDWLYVRDHCEAIWTVMTQGQTGETYNIGGGSEMPNIRVVEIICEILDALRPDAGGRPRRDLITFVKDRPGHDRRYAIDAAKAYSALGWSPRTSFVDGIESTVRWYLDHSAWVQRVRNGEYRNWISQQYGES